MTTQIAVKLPDEIVARIDELVARGVFASRSAAVRRGLEVIVSADRRRAIDRAYEEAYRRFPETDDELRAAERLATLSIEEEPWGEVVVERGDVWWGEAPDEKGRPYRVVSRDAANRVMRQVLVAPVSFNVRGLPSELLLGRDEGPSRRVRCVLRQHPAVPEVVADAACRRARRGPPVRDLLDGRRRARLLSLGAEPQRQQRAE